MERPLFTLVLSTVFALATLHFHAQEPPELNSASPTFEVASIRRNTGPPGPPQLDARTFRQNGRVTVTNMSLLAILQVLYRTDSPTTIAGGPSWIRSDRFDLAAIGEPGADVEVPAGMSLPRMSAMMKALLVDRFKLRTHIEHRPTQMYALLPKDPRKPTAKLTRTNAVCEPGQCGSRQISLQGIAGTSMDMDELASALSRVSGVGTPVENRTGIEGRFDIAIRFGDEPAATIPERGARAITALDEQLGLTLRQERVRQEVVVIDHVEHPSPN